MFRVVQTKSSSEMIITGDCELRHSEQSTQMTQELKVITTETHSVGPLFYSLPSIFVPITSVCCVALTGVCSVSWSPTSMAVLRADTSRQSR